jgi:hypothetical protein
MHRSAGWWDAHETAVLKPIQHQRQYQAIPFNLLNRCLYFCPRKPAAKEGAQKPGSGSLSPDRDFLGFVLDDYLRGQNLFKLALPKVRQDAAAGV